MLPGADAEKIRRRYEERTALLRGEMISGAPSNVLIVVRRAQDVLGALLDLKGWLAPAPGRPKRVPVPDIRGLFYDVAMEVVGRLGLKITSVQRTPHPMPVDGLVVDQSPRAPGTLRRDETVTAHGWHPPARFPGPGR